jgi:hypothetical protein
MFCERPWCSTNDLTSNTNWFGHLHNLGKFVINNFTDDITLFRPMFVINQRGSLVVALCGRSVNMAVFWEIWGFNFHFNWNRMLRLIKLLSIT